jgi:hypothetical protein
MRLKTIPLSKISAKTGIEYLRFHPNIKMSECQTVRVRHPVSPVPDWKKLTMPLLRRYRIKVIQSGIFYSGTGLG